MPQPCPACATDIPDGAQFCPHCGAAPDDSLRPTQKLRRVSADAIGVQEPSILQAIRRATVGEYDIATEIGSGGMATVFLAHDIALNRKVAIKVMSPELMVLGKGIRDRFKREAQTAAALSHPHIIPVYAVKDSRDLAYIVMKYVVGRSLESVIHEVGPLAVPVVQTLLTQVSSALAYAHRKKVVHRDMKPGNVMLDEEGWAMVTDFGIAKVTEAEALTIAGSWVGTPEYMSPEQINGNEVTGAADQYSLGIMAFEMLTGKPPFQANSMMAVMKEHCNTVPPSVLEFRPDCPGPLASAVARMLEKQPGDRFPGMDELVATIGTLGDTAEYTVQTQVQGLVKRTSTSRLLEKFNTPASPVPRSALRPSPAPTSAPATRQGRRWLWIVPVVLAAGAGVLLLATGGGPPTPVDAPSAAAPRPVLAGLDVSPAGGTFTIGETLGLNASGRDSLGTPLGAIPVAWESADPAVAAVSGAGIVTGVAPGTTRITARLRGTSAAVSVTVLPHPVAPPASRPAATRARVLAMSVVPGEATAQVGGTVLFTARATDGSGRYFSAGVDVAWSSSAPTVATVTQNGVVTAVAPGTTWIMATSNGKSAGGMMTVIEAPAAIIAATPAPPPIPAPAAAPVAAPSPVATDPRPDIERVLERYRVALESRDLGQLKAAYPGMTPDQERAWRSFFNNASQLAVTLRVSDVAVTGPQARARLEAVYRFRTDRSQTQSLLLTASLEQAADGWRLARIQ